MMRIACHQLSTPFLQLGPLADLSRFKSVLFTAKSKGGLPAAA